MTKPGLLCCVVCLWMCGSSGAESRRAPYLRAVGNVHLEVKLVEVDVGVLERIKGERSRSALPGVFSSSQIHRLWSAMKAPQRAAQPRGGRRPAKVAPAIAGAADARFLASIELTVPAGKQRSTRQGRTFHYVGDYDVTKDGITSVSRTRKAGLSLKVGAWPVPAAKEVFLTLELDCSDVAQPIATRTVAPGSIGLPVQWRARLGTSLRVPDGGIVLAGTVSRPPQAGGKVGHTVAVLVRAQVDNKGTPVAKTSGDANGKPLDLSAFTAPLSHFSLVGAAPQEASREVWEGPWIARKDESHGASTREIIADLSRRVPRAILRPRAGGLDVVGPAESITAVERAAASLWARSRPQVAVEAKIIALHDSLLDGIRSRSSRAHGPAVLTAAQVSQIAAAVGKKQAEMLWAGELLCQEGQRVCSTSWGSRSYIAAIASRTIQVGEQVKTLVDPEIRDLGFGTTFGIQVRRRRPAEKAKQAVQLDLFLDFKRATFGGTTRSAWGDIETPISDASNWSTRVDVPRGRTVLIGGAASIGEKKIVALIYVRSAP